jgi:hypothetical protein
MAKQLPKPAQTFLTKLATDPTLLGEFIKDPDHVMKQYKIDDKKMRDAIRSCLALEVAKKLLICPDAFHVHW